MGREAGYTTILKLLQIMTEKRLVVRDEARANPHLRRGVYPGSDAAPAGDRPARARVRRLGRQARAAGAGRHEDVAGRARRNQETAARRRRRRRTTTASREEHDDALVLLQTAGWALIHFVWQGAAIAGAASLLLTAHAAPVGERPLRHRLRGPGRHARRAARHRAPDVDRQQTRHRTITAFNAAVTCSAAGAHHIVSADLDALQAHARAATAQRSRVLPRRDAVSGGAAVSAPAIAIERVLPSITIAWLAGVVLLLARMAGGWWHVRRLHRLALATPSSRWQTSCRRLAYRLGLPAAAHVVESALVDVPTVVGWLRPAILLPIAAIAVAVAVADRSDPRARARAHPPPRLRGQRAADDRRDAAVLSPGGVVGLEADPRSSASTAATTSRWRSAAIRSATRRRSPSSRAGARRRRRWRWPRPAGRCSIASAASCACR